MKEKVFLFTLSFMLGFLFFPLTFGIQLWVYNINYISLIVIMIIFLYVSLIFYLNSTYDIDELNNMVFLFSLFALGVVLFLLLVLYLDEKIIENSIFYLYILFGIIIVFTFFSKKILSGTK